jgi:hypothetical protein
VSFLQVGELELQRTIRTLELSLELYPQPCQTYPPNLLKLSFDSALARWSGEWWGGEAAYGCRT